MRAHVHGTHEVIAIWGTALKWLRRGLSPTGLTPSIWSRGAWILTGRGSLSFFECWPRGSHLIWHTFGVTGCFLRMETGGPIFALSFCPTPPNRCHLFLFFFSFLAYKTLGIFHIFFFSAGRHHLYTLPLSIISERASLSLGWAPEHRDLPEGSLYMLLEPQGFFFFFNTYILLKYSWLTMFQGHLTVIQLYKYTLFLKLFSIRGYYKILTIVPYAIQ